MWHKIQRSLAGPKLLRAFADAYPRAVFVEIGSNDGEQHDHLREFILEREWRGVMAEPVPYVFARLQDNYAGIDRVALENVAIADRDGSLPFFHLADATPEEREQMPDWYDGIGSLSREGVLGHAPQIPDLADRLVETQVPSLSFSSLLRRHGLETVDLVLIDTEGHDWEIIRHIDLAAHRPRLLVYEHYHLAAADRAACRGHLEAAGFTTMEEGLETFCLRPEPDELTRTFQGLAPYVAGVSAEEDGTR
jgi:FkbM family methyltransferase